MTAVSARVDGPASPAAAAIRTRPANVARAMAAIGAASAVLAVYVYGSWIVSGDAVRTPTGSDPVPGTTKLWITLYEIVGPLLAIAFIFYLVRSWRRDGIVTLPGAVFIAWTVCLWLDPATLNFVRPQMLYNSYALNVGSWGPHIPGWISPNARLLPEPLLAYSGVYGAQVLLALIALEVMRRVRRRRPELSAAGLMVRALLVLMAVDLVLEVILIRAEFWAYAGVVQRLSIWGGHRYQFPLYEPVLFGGLNVVIGAMLFFKDDRGRSFIERGAVFRSKPDQVTSTTRILTVTGFVTLVYLTYSLAIGFLGLYGGPYPDGYKSYMLNGMCGPGTKVECVGPKVPLR